MDNELVIGGVVVIPLLIGWVQLLKRFFPNAPGNLWLGLVLVFSVAISVVATIADNGVPANLQTWLTVVIVGLAFGLSASKVYDETIGGSA